jgi:hypothetical protein
MASHKHTQDDDKVCLDEVMSPDVFKSRRRAILQTLQALPLGTDPPPRLVTPGAGPPSTPFENALGALRSQKYVNARLVRGYRLIQVPLPVFVWKAYFHVVISNTVEVHGKAEEQYADVTAAYNNEDKGKRYVFVPSSRAHKDLDEDALFGGRFYFGAVVGGHEAYVDAIIQHYRFHGLRRDIVADSPETCLARPRVMVTMYHYFQSWHKDTNKEEALDGLGEKMGFLTAEYNPGVALQLPSARMCASANADVGFRKVKLISNAADDLLDPESAPPGTNKELRLCESAATKMLKAKQMKDTFAVLSGVETLMLVLMVERHKALGWKGAMSCEKEKQFFYDHYDNQYATVKKILERRKETSSATLSLGQVGARASVHTF